MQTFICSQWKGSPTSTHAYNHILIYTIEILCSTACSAQCLNATFIYSQWIRMMLPSSTWTPSSLGRLGVYKLARWWLIQSRILQLPHTSVQIYSINQVYPWSVLAIHFLFSIWIELFALVFIMGSEDFCRVFSIIKVKWTWSEYCSLSFFLFCDEVCSYNDVISEYIDLQILVYLYMIDPWQRWHLNAWRAFLPVSNRFLRSKKKIFASIIEANCLLD